MAWQTMALLAASTALKIGGSMFGGLGAEYAADYNRQLAKHKGRYAKKVARVEEKDLREMLAKAVGAATAASGASGFATESGSSQDAIDAIVRSGELDAAMIRHMGDIGAWEAKTEADKYKAEGRLSMLTGYLGAGAAGLEGLGTHAYRGGWFKKKGA
jgi:hypothetical protein